jgi:hypothetical protein
MKSSKKYYPVVEIVTRPTQGKKQEIITGPSLSPKPEKHSCPKTSPRKRRKHSADAADDDLAGAVGVLCLFVLVINSYPLKGIRSWTGFAPFANSIRLRNASFLTSHTERPLNTF